LIQALGGGWDASQPSIDHPYQVNGHHRTIGLCTETYIQG
jgi:hypothetical protein